MEDNNHDIDELSDFSLSHLTFTFTRDAIKKANFRYIPDWKITEFYTVIGQNSLNCVSASTDKLEIIPPESLGQAILWAGAYMPKIIVCFHKADRPRWGCNLDNILASLVPHL